MTRMPHTSVPRLPCWSARLNHGPRRSLVAFVAPATLSRPSFVLTLRWPRWRLSDAPALARRVGQFWLVWSALLLVHEVGHALAASRQGLVVRRVTIGMGPALWRTTRGETQLVLRLVPVAGLTVVGAPPMAAARRDHATRWSAWRRQGATLAGGVAATLAAAVGIGALVLICERATRRRCVWGRILVADAVVLTVFNFLPVPPLDGGRAVLAGVDALRGAPLSGDARFWVHLGGLALAVVPMTLWTRWTARIDATAMWWGAPRGPAEPSARVALGTPMPSPTCPADECAGRPS